jgi:uncharacterized OsmC-like protein
MSTAKIGEAVERAAGFLRAHPEEARYVDSEAVAVPEAGLRIRVVGPDGAVTTDMPTSVGGTGSAPSPGWMLRAALASCTATLISIEAAREAIELSLLEVAVDSESDDRGILGIDESVPAGPLSIRVRVRLAADGVPEAQLRSLAERATRRCPVDDAVRRPVPTALEVDVVSGT